MSKIKQLHYVGQGCLPPGCRKLAVGGKRASNLISRIFVFGWIIIITRGEEYNTLRSDGVMVYRGHRDCYCFLVFAVLVIFLGLVRHSHQCIRDLSPPVLIRQVAIHLRSALNGSHGEATNSDDVLDHMSLCEMVESELEVAEEHCGMCVDLGVWLTSDELMNFALICGAVTNLVNASHSVRGLLESLMLVKLCVAEEACSTLSYTELMYDLFIHRTQTLKICRAELGEQFYHFMQYDIDNVVLALGSSPRESQLRSSHGEMTEGDDLAYTGMSPTECMQQLSGCATLHVPDGNQGKRGGRRNFGARERMAWNKRMNREAWSTANGNPMCAEQNRRGQPVVNLMVDRAPQANTFQAVQKVGDCQPRGEKKERQERQREVVKFVSWEDYPNGAQLLSMFEQRDSKPFYFDGQSYSTIMGERAEVSNFQCLCKEVGYGYVKVIQVTNRRGKWVDCETQNRSQPILPLVTIVDVDGYKRHHLSEAGVVDMTKIIVCPPTRHIVLLPLFRRMQKLPNSGLDSLHDRATECSVDRVSDLVIPAWLIASTVAHRRCQLDMAEVIHHDTSANVKITKYGAAFGLGDDVGLDHLLSNCMVQTYQFMHIEHKRNRTAPDYPVRDDFTVLKGHEYLDEDNRVVFPVGEGYIKNQYSTWMCGFNGINQPPGYYHANDAGGMNLGLKRVLGAKGSLENELRLRGAAKTLGKNILKCGRSWRPPLSAWQREHVLDFVADTYRDDHQGWDADARDRLEKAFHLFTKRDPRMNPGHPQAYTGAIDSGCSKFIAEKAHKLASSCRRYKVREIMDGIAGGTKWLYYSIMKSFLDVYHSAFTRQQISNLPHLKKKLRQAYCRGIRLHDPENVLLDRMKAAVKNELSKFGKAPRLYQQMGRGCMYAPELVEFAKVLIDGIHVEKSGGVTMVVMVFGKRKDGDLEKFFNQMADALDCVNTVVAGVYSDDMVVAGCLETPSGRNVFAYNVDVSSNDSSQDLPAFLTTFMILNKINRDRALGLVEQCMKPIEIVNPENRDQKVEVVFNGPFEGSGSTLTTLLNHIGSYLILMGSLYWMGKLDKRVQCGPVMSVEECIRRGASEVGHEVTVETCSDGEDVIFERLTFLHMHPARVVERSERCCGRSYGNWIPRIDIGCIMRKWGRVDGSLTHIKLGMGESPASIALFGAMSPQQRLDAFCGGVVRGWKNEAECPILAAFRHRYATETSNDVVVVELEKDASRYNVRDDINYRDVKICPGTLGRRYNLDFAEIDAIVSGIKSMHVGTFVVTSGVAKIMEVCYGVQEIPDSQLWTGLVYPDDELGLTKTGKPIKVPKQVGAIDKCVTGRGSAAASTDNASDDGSEQADWELSFYGTD